MIRRLVLAIPFLLLSVSAKADIYNFSYVGIYNTGVHGSGTITTGIAYGDGYLQILSITGTTEAGKITGLEVSGGPGADPNNYVSCCGVGPGGDYFDYDNAFMPGSLNPFSSLGGVLFDVVGGAPTSPINLFGDGKGDTYEFSYGEDTFTGSGPSYGGTLIKFTATLTPEPSFYVELAIGLIGLAFFAIRRRRNA